MPIPKKWKIVSGGLGVAVALSAGVAVADDGEGDDDAPELDDVVSVQDVETPDMTFAFDEFGITDTDGDDALASPFDDDNDPEDTPIVEGAAEDDSPDTDDTVEDQEGDDSPDTDDTVEGAEQ